MRFGPSLMRTLAFTVVYVGATYLGRLTVMDETNLSLVWPAAGVSAVWFLVQYASRWRFLDVAALSAATIVVNIATGAPPVLALWFVAANLVQAGVFAWLFRRWLPGLWGAGGERPLARLAELWRLIAAAFLSTACGTMIGPTGVWVVNGVYSWPASAVWLTRNTVSILLIGAVGVRVGRLLHAWRTDPEYRGALRRWRALGPHRRLEYVLLVVASAVAYTAVFGIDHRLPLAFTVIVVTVWAASRLHTTFVVVHDLVFGTVAVLFTLGGTGVFAHIPSYPARALVAQAFVGVITVVGLALALGRDERVALVRQVSAGERAAARQAGMLTAIVESMTEGLTVVDEEGRVLLRNPAVGRLVGGVVGDTGRMAEPGHYGLFHPDGRPLAPEEMPHRRALAGTDVRNTDILVRNPGVPAGRLLSVSSTALSDDAEGRRYAVTVFHDVTAERRHRDELASFAGTVAHDLQNPLATVEGWSEALTGLIEEAADHPAMAEAADANRRIQRATARMRNMINDLLAYTTARDAALQPTMVDLAELVADIAAARVDQARSNDLPVPVVHAGEVHPVYADPVLVRQLLENLLGNAIKYTAPGVTPQITVTTERDERQVTVTIDDNGIGIPPGQHDTVFENFHRAHQRSGYAGTGLGLGICKRIVERHGGSIRAAANPAGHGTRLVFTLPADASAVPAEPEPSPPAPPVPVPGHAAPGDEDPAPAQPAPVFEHTARLVLDYLHERMPLAFWSVTRVENGRQTYLYLDADNGYGLRQGQSHPWEQSFCIHMAAGRAPAVALDAQRVPAYANAGVNALIDIGTYAGAVIAEPDGTLFGAICGLDPQARPGDARMADAEPLLALLGRMLTVALAADRAQDRSAIALLHEQSCAETDTLTGLPNRRAWERFVAHARSRYERLGDPTVIAVLDLDGLKVINDSQGHAAGDAYLIAAATAIRRALRDTDVVARLGGDEFGFLLYDCTETDADRAIARIEAQLSADGVEASVGWAAVDPATGFAAALDRADAAMYAAKVARRRVRAGAG
ncbi:diguanylate cyclase domain-containing protein [Catenuloplanes atrovinosus]|uniref:Sensor-like histidine kinase SenX3 n=1 Tax=Catenuloplanes atrovinosus TaxID=137266 RepID=A0AAE3YMS4_9ACTN|nr:diguanylate cyclase [Catenuloplanes atrovinosus]MDR7276365.1 diguanylate cyclase (GGDEF)-like protein [Catenuloplanes atrovinosus]